MWRRLDLPGHDVAWLEQRANGWLLSGNAVFRHKRGPAAITYEVECTAEWVTRRGLVRGMVGSSKISIAIQRERNGRWWINGSEAPDVEGLLDLDYGFTPATNFNQLRREIIEIGESRSITVAWTDIDEPSLTVLPQRYERISERKYVYSSPAAGYEETLILNESGFVAEYPRLWIS
jgi:uncharacterized protein